MSPEPDGHLLSTTATSLRIIDIIKENDGAQASELLDELDTSRSSLYNHLVTLRETGYITKEGNMYQVGLKYFNIGQYARTRKSSYKLVHDVALELTKETGLEVDFSIKDGNKVIVVFDETSTSDWNSFQLGMYQNMHATAAGKAILAELPEEEVEEIIEQEPLVQLGPGTITSRTELLSCLRKIKKEGYAINDEETTEGIQAVATTIRGPTRNIIGALSVSGPKYRYPEFHSIADKLVSKVENLEQRLSEETKRNLRDL